MASAVGDGQVLTDAEDVAARVVPIGFDEDSLSCWLVFVVIYVALVAFDLGVLAPRVAPLGGGPAPRLQGKRLCLFWVGVGLLFNAGVWASLGTDSAMVWFNGYLLEYLLSLDNVFFFHVVFNAYSTPEEQKYKALSLGVLGSLVLRLGCYCACAAFLHLAFAVQLLFGVVLIWSGYKTAMPDEEDEDPRNSRCVQIITRCLPISHSYDPMGRLFTRSADVDPAHAAAKADVAPGGANDAERGQNGDDVVSAPPLARRRIRGTLLLLVVVVLQVIDALFAVDSVTAKLAEHSGVFLNFSSTAMAMLCLKSLYFVLVGMLTTLRFMKYGVAAIQVLLGVKLLLSAWVEVEEVVSLVVICAVFFLSIALSLRFPGAPAGAGDDLGDAELAEQPRAGQAASGEGERQ